jgi:hypothetical protein
MEKAAVLCSALLAVSAAVVQAAEIPKLSSGAFNDGSGWEGGSVPGSEDVGVFDSSTVPDKADAVFGSSGAKRANIGCLKVTDIKGPVTINQGGATDTICGVDMSAAAADVTFAGGCFRIASAYPEIKIAPGRTLMINNGDTTSASIYTETIAGGGTFVVMGLWTGNGRIALDVTGKSTIAGTGVFQPNNTSSGWGIRVGSGSAVSPGIDGIGTLTMNGSGTSEDLLVMEPGAFFKFDLGEGGKADLISLTNVVAGDVKFNNNIIDFCGTGSEGVFRLFDSSLAAAAGADAWDGLAMNGQTITGGLSVQNLAAGLSGTLYLGDGVNGDLGDIYLQVVGHRKPGSTMMFLGVGAFLLLFIRHDG